MCQHGPSKYHCLHHWDPDCRNQCPKHGQVRDASKPISDVLTGSSLQPCKTSLTGLVALHHSEPHSFSSTMISNGRLRTSLVTSHNYHPRCTRESRCAAAPLGSTDTDVVMTKHGNKLIRNLHNHSIVIEMCAANNSDMVPWLEEFMNCVDRGFECLTLQGTFGAVDADNADLYRDRAPTATRLVLDRTI